MKNRKILLFAMMAVLLTVTVFGGAGAAGAGKESAVRTILIWAGGAEMDSP